MKSNHLKELLKHIILEINSQFQGRNEMIANKDVPPDVFGAVNVEESNKKKICFHCKKPRPCACDKYDDENQEASDPESPKFDSKRFGTKSTRNPITGKLEFEEGIFDFIKGTGEIKKKAEKLFKVAVKKVQKVSHPTSNSEYFLITLSTPDSPPKLIRKDKSGKWFLLKDFGDKKKFIPVSSELEMDEESSSGAAGAYSTPFAFKPTGGAGEKRRKKKKKSIKESQFLNKIQKKLTGLTNEKTNPDGTYSDDMEDGRRSNRISGMTEVNGTRYFAEIPIGSEFKIPGQQPLFRKIDQNTAVLGRKKVKIKNDTLVNVHGGVNEMTSSGAVGQPGGMIQTPAWGTKNKLGSPRGIKGSEKLGYKVVRSITNEGK